ncbi:hypothetical protein [Rhizobium sp. 18055]|uniref:hypothetical protein n=1 Tax=Rhizobium sp. 18055 TaxID=2681403 RepID=UPI0013571E03|nr:hypothetical protein [Rhizobium sp. 18055]
MLTPVRAASSSSFPSQGSASLLGADDIVRTAATSAPVNQVESPDLTSAVTAKLNILLLAVRARMVEALLDVLNAAGDAIAQPRDGDEPELVFAARLADAIQKLPAAKIEAVERQLAAQGHTIPLRLLAEALKNPAGSEATRIAAYLETIGFKDRDLATRAVVRSYGQNDGSPLPARPEQRPEISLHRDSVPAAAARALPSLPVDVEAEAPAGNATIAGDAATDADIAEQPVVSAGTLLNAAEAADAADAVVVASTGSNKAAEAAETDEAALIAEPETLAVAAEAVDETTEADARSATAKSDPIIPKSWAGIAASLSKDETDMIVVIIRDQQSEVLLEAADVEPAIEIDVLLDDTLIADIPDNLTRPSDQTLLPGGTTRQANPLSAPSALEAAAARAAANDQPATEAAVPSAARQMIDATYAPVMMRIVEGVPYAIQPYDFAKDETDDGGSHEMNREDHNGDLPKDGEEEEAEAQAAPEHEEEPVLSAAPGDAEDEPTAQIATTAAEPARVAASGMLMLPAPSLPMTPVIDEAYARYKRMVGWE